MTPDQYCQERTARSGSSFYYSFVFLPPEQRRAITALYAFCREVDDAVDECSDRQVARLKLGWWREELERTYRGEPRHPVGQALLPAIERHGLARAELAEVIEGMEMDLEQDSYPSFAELALYCHRVAGVVGGMAAKIFGYRNPTTLRYAERLGLAFQLTNILRDVREDAMRGRVYIPADELAAHGVTREMLNHPRTPENLRALLQRQARRAHAQYDEALALLPEEDRYRQLSGLVMAAIYRATLREIEADGYRILEHRVGLPPLRKLWLAWRTARHERRRARRARAR